MRDVGYGEMKSLLRCLWCRSPHDHVQQQQQRRQQRVKGRFWMKNRMRTWVAQIRNEGWRVWNVKSCGRCW